MVEMRGVLDLEMIRGNDEDSVGYDVGGDWKASNELDDRHSQSWSRQRIHTTYCNHNIVRYGIGNGMRLDSAEQPTAE